MRAMRAVLALALVGCMQKQGGPSASYAESDSFGSAGWGGAGDYDDAMPMAEAESSRSDRAPRPSKSMPSPPPPPPPPSAPGRMPSPVTTAPEPPPESPQSAPVQDRMVHYDGWARLRASDPQEVLDRAVALAEEAGGRTERLSGNTVSLRVPVARFDELWDAFLGLADVMDRSVRADDVTEAFLAVELRVKTLEATRDRLVELLAKAKDEHEKLMLLQELTRVTEELDAVQSQMRTLSDLASMSRITLEVVPREAFSGTSERPELAGFEWIRGLSPFRRAVWSDDKRVALPVPDGLVGLAPRGPFVAESADGTVLWTMRVRNDPVGDADFWADTLQDRIADEFANPVRTEVGAWDCLSLDEPGTDAPYLWLVCVQDAGAWLWVSQAWFPGATQSERYSAGVEGALKAGGES